MSVLRKRGVAVVLVSHRLGEVYEISDRVIVMRDGQKVGEGIVDALPKREAIRLMAGERLVQEITGDVKPVPQAESARRGDTHPRRLRACVLRR